ncbi:MAG: type II toxin-antitoxin system RatA family toxin [Methylocella sp.]
MSFRNRRHVPHSSADMFAIVFDVESYPKFVPRWGALRVRHRSAAVEGIEVIVAEMEVGFETIYERVTSRVTCKAPSLEILVEYIDGPFKFLENRWSFHDESSDKDGGPRSVVDFFIAYEFKNRALGMVISAVFDTVFQGYADAFVKRAGEVYGCTGAGHQPNSAKSQNHAPRWAAPSDRLTYQLSARSYLSQGRQTYEAS